MLASLRRVVVLAYLRQATCQPGAQLAAWRSLGSKGHTDQMWGTLPSFVNPLLG